MDLPRGAEGEKQPISTGVTASAPAPAAALCFLGRFSGRRRPARIATFVIILALAAAERQSKRGFCPNCGSQIAMKLESMPDVLGLQAGSLAHPSRYYGRLLGRRAALAT
jgi:hypothetical protein